MEITGPFHGKAKKLSGRPAASRCSNSRSSGGCITRRSRSAPARVDGGVPADVRLRHGDGAHYRDLRSRGRAFIAAGFGERYADTVTRQEILGYVKSRDCAPRTMRNQAGISLRD